MKFSDLRLAEPILRAVSAEGYVTATPIQAQSIPHIRDGADLLGCAQTGTGKTAAFALPILHRLSQNTHAPAKPQVRCLVLCPTRELATQIADSFRAYGKNLKLRSAVVFGGVSQHGQVESLRRGVEILIATPGRLLDLMNQGFVDLRGVEVLVLDEADRMLDMGFIHDIRKISAKLPAKRQTLLFSATMPTEIRQLANSLLKNPVSVQVAPVSSTVDTIDQTVYFVDSRNKPVLLAHLYNELPMARTIVFTRTKHGADRVVRHLHKRGIRAEAIHGNKSQNARTRALDNFRNNKTPILVATDIASRGIDVDGITHVVNYDISHEPETYVHRIGRTARAGASGTAVSFCSPDEVSNLKAVESLIRKRLHVKHEQPDYPKTEDNGQKHAPRANAPRHQQRAQHAPRHEGQRQHAPRHQEQRQNGQRPAAAAPKPHHAPRSQAPRSQPASKPFPLHAKAGHHPGGRKRNGGRRRPAVWA